jgi:hypothetical protein
MSKTLRLLVVVLECWRRHLEIPASGAAQRCILSFWARPSAFLTRRPAIRPVRPPGKTPSKSARSLSTRCLKEWTTGDAHDVTDRTLWCAERFGSTTSLPGDKVGQWVWQRGPWLHGGPGDWPCVGTQAAGLRPGREPRKLGFAITEPIAE